MPLRNYGVLAGRPVDQRRESGHDTPHYQIRVVDDAGVHYRIAVNVQSRQAPSELLYLVDEAFDHPILRLLPRDGGWTPLPSRPGGPNLDFVRGNLFDRMRMRPLPADVHGPDNDLSDLLGLYVLRAIAEPDARIYAFGERWGPEGGSSDDVFGFRPGNGVHDIHMNQGNSEAFRGDDGVWQDGALLMHFPAQDQWVGVFLAFQSQGWHTDDTTGHAVSGPPEGQPRVRIVGALVNPRGPAPEAEVVTLLNASAEPVDLTGWRLADRMRASCPVAERGSATLGPGETLAVPVTAGVALGNSGGTITLLDAAGLKVDGVAYTGAQAAEEGWTLVF